MNPHLDSVAITLLVTITLDRLHIPYFIGGSLAGIMYGEYRTTQDTDIVAALQPQHIAPFIAALTHDFYLQPEAITQALADVALVNEYPEFRPSFNLIHLATGFKIDIFMATHRPFETSQFQRRTYETLAINPPRTAAVTTAEDIVLAKLEWYNLGSCVSTQQWRDILAILKVQTDQLDQIYLRNWAEHLHIRDLLDLALAESA